MAASSKSEEQRAMTSMRVFREFIRRVIRVDGTDTLDANDSISRQCYDMWVSTRKTLPPNPEKAFQRSLSAHVTGVDGRVPFTPQEEEAVLKVLRRKERWPCFEDSATRFGLMGFRAKGFHEKSNESTSISQSELMRKRMKNDEDYKNELEKAKGVKTSAFPQMPMMPQQYAMPAYPYRIPFGNRMLNAAPLGTMSRPDSYVMGTYPGVIPPGLFNSPMMTPTQLPSSVMGDGQKRQDFVLPPPQQDLSDGKVSFIDTASIILNNAPVNAGMDAWSTILSMGRMMLVSAGWTKPPTTEDAAKLLNQYNERFPGQLIALFDIACRQLREIVVSQNASAQRFFGQVARNQSGLDRFLFPHTNAWLILTTVFKAYKSPGLEINVELSLIGVDGSTYPAACGFVVHPQERTLVVHAQLLA